MTATNHALTGAVIALAVKQPALAIPLAFLSHFALDVLPHYNPAGVKGFHAWSEKFRDPLFWVVLVADGLLFLAILAVSLFAHTTVSRWTIFFSALVAVSPDLVSVYQLALDKLFGKHPRESKFDRFHIGIQGYEKPDGIVVEILWFLLMLYLIHLLAK